MNPLIQFKTTPRLLTTLTLLCFGLLPKAQAVVPPPDGGYPGFNTAEGTNALKNLTTGVGNTATGWHSLFANTAGNLNTGVGAGTLLFNAGDNNTATGALALLNNTGGFYNTADGAFALFSNTTGSGNTGSGYQALFTNQTGANNAAYGYTALSNNTGSFNTAYGSQTLVFNTTGDQNTAAGYQALVFNTGGSANTASGEQALYANTTGAINTAVGALALSGNTTGNANIGIGYGGGQNLTTGGGNIDIGNDGFAGEDNTIRIGNVQTATYIGGIFGQSADPFDATSVFIDGAGKLGTVISSQRFKRDIKPMDKASEAILALKPVAFHYATDAKNTPCFGLIAEEVAVVNPALVVRDKAGKPYTVRYDAVNAMLLNEFLKAHGKVQEQTATISELQAKVAQQRKTFDSQLAEQQKQIDALTEGLQKVSAQLEASKPEPQVVNSP